MNKKNSVAKKLSFTLIEIIVAVAIIVLISTTVFLSFSIFTPRRLETDARKVVADIRLTRQMAMTTPRQTSGPASGQPYIYAVSFDKTNTDKEYSIYRTQTGVRGELTALNLIKKGVIQASLNLVNTNLWIYSPKGNFYFYNQDNITLSNQGKSKQIKVSPATGYVKVE